MQNCFYNNKTRILLSLGVYIENKNVKGHWVGIFSGNEKRATIDFREYIEPRKWFMTPFVKMHLKYWQMEYVMDLRNVLKSVSL